MGTGGQPVPIFGMVRASHVSRDIGVTVISQFEACFVCSDTPLDLKVKFNIIADLLSLIGEDGFLKRHLLNG